MSLQPGPHDPSDDSALTPPVPEPGDAAPGPAAAPPPPPPPPAAGWPTPPPAAGPTWPAPPPAAPAAPAPDQGAWPAQAAPAPDSWASAAGPADQGAWQAPPPAPGGYSSPPPPQGYSDSWAGVPQGSPGYPPTGYPPTGYPPAGYQAVGYPTPSQTDNKAVVGLILAIASWVVCPLITAVIALVLAGQSNRAIDASGGRLEGRSMNTATKWVAWANIIVTVLLIVAGLALFAFAVTTDSTVITDLTDPDTQF